MFIFKIYFSIIVISCFAVRSSAGFDLTDWLGFNVTGIFPSLNDNQVSSDQLSTSKEIPKETSKKETPQVKLSSYKENELLLRQVSTWQPTEIVYDLTHIKMSPHRKGPLSRQEILQLMQNKMSQNKLSTSIETKTSNDNSLNDELTKEVAAPLRQDSSITVNPLTYVLVSIRLLSSTCEQNNLVFKLLLFDLIRSFMTFYKIFGN